MGNELSCPCGNRTDIEETPKEVSNDILQTVLRGKLTKEQLIYEYTASNDKMKSKICLLATNNLEGFFNNRNLLSVDNKREINCYYNLVYISNFLNQDTLACVILQYKKTQDANKDAFSNKKHAKNDYGAVYKVESINFVSNDPEKIKEQLLNDLYMLLKKQYRFYGIISDESITPYDNNVTPGNHVSHSMGITPSQSCQILGNNSNKNYKILYKKSKLTDNLDINYTIHVHNNNLTSDAITQILSANKDKTLKSVLKNEHRTKDKKQCPFWYYFIFEGNKITPEYDESEFLVVHLEKDNSTADSFLKDIAEKINMNHNANLLCVINDKGGFYLVFKLEIPDMDDDEDETDLYE